MKEKTHPTYYPKATVVCACGHKFIVGSTRPELQIEICSNCHPFYTGKEKLIDTAGRIERFASRRSKASTEPTTKKKVRRAATKAKSKK